jgi:membrane-bound lytic murein transglycosylase D
MSLLHRIPHLVSALAFGYGIGMTAPDAALAPVQAAVVAASDPQAASRPAPVKAAAAPLPARPSAQGPRGVAARASAGGDESPELSRLRDAGMRERGEACALDRPTYSRPPRMASTPEGEFETDDLDAAGAEALSRLQLPDLKVSITHRTLKYVRFFTRSERGRHMFETWLKRSGRYADMIQRELRDRRLPEDLIWVSMIESGFDPRAKSPAGAVGLWQFMPATGAVYGLQQNRFLDQRKNPMLATRAAVHHLRDLYMRFGSWDLALAAYNMGYEQLLDRIDQYGTADFNELARQEAIPSETASYVPKIAAAALVANNLERFGFDQVEIARPVDEGEIAVPAGTSLRTIAKGAGVSLKTVRALNPDILTERVPPGRGDYLVMIPAESLSRAHATLPVLLQTEPLQVDDTAALDPVDLITGKQLRRRQAQSEEESLLSLLPPYKKRRALRDPLAGLDEPPAGGGDDEASADDDDEPMRVVPRRKRSGRQTLVYRVGPGDTLIGVARQFAMDVDDVARDNGLDEDAKLKSGTMLRLRVKRGMLASGALAELESGAEGKAGARGEGATKGETRKGDAEGRARDEAARPEKPSSEARREGAGKADGKKRGQSSRRSRSRT